MGSSTTITIRLPRRLREAIYDRAEAAHTSASDWCRSALAKRLADHEESDRLGATADRIIGAITARIDALEFTDEDSEGGAS